MKTPKEGLESTLKESKGGADVKATTIVGEVAHNIEACLETITPQLGFDDIMNKREREEILNSEYFNKKYEYLLSVIQNQILLEYNIHKREIKKLGLPEELSDFTLQEPIYEEHLALSERGAEYQSNLRLNLTNCANLPEILYVKGNFVADFCCLVIAPKFLRVKGSFSAKYSGLRKIPENTYIGESLLLKGTRIEEYPENIFVGEGIELADTPIEKLPKEMTINGDFDLEGAKRLKKLPDTLKVSGYLDLRGTQVEELPDTLEVGGILFLNEYLTEKLDFIRDGLSEKVGKIAPYKK